MKKIMTIIFIFICFHVYADSPLTSTDFHIAYSDIKIVKQTGPVLEKKHFEYFTSNNPIEYKMAIINKSSWNIKRKSNYPKFLEYLTNKYNIKAEKKLLKKCSADELLCLAYIKAMDNYFNVKRAMSIAQRAVSKNPKSYTFQIINALIHAQHALDSDWCRVFTLPDSIRKNKKLKSDFREEAKKIIFKYIDLYEDSCKKK